MKTTNTISNTTRASAFLYTLKQVIPPRDCSDRTAFRRVAKWLTGECDGGRFFTACSTKRTDGSQRVMLCRAGVHPAPGPSTIQITDYNNLVSVWDVQKREFRYIPIEGIQWIRLTRILQTHRGLGAACGRRQILSTILRLLPRRRSGHGSGQESEIMDKSQSSSRCFATPRRGASDAQGRSDRDLFMSAKRLPRSAYACA